jgi:hypothetical protein
MLDKDSSKSQTKRWLFIGGGGVVVLILAITLGLFLSAKYKTGEKMNAQASGLTVNVADQEVMDVKKPLRCFVNGSFVGQLTLGECAKKNGVAAQQLDVGLDDSGEVVAAPTASLAPPPVMPILEQVEKAVEKTPEPVTQATQTGPEATPNLGPVAPCLRYSGNQWNRLADALTLNQCVSLLYQGRCEKPGAAAYGRWDGKTLRLVPRKVEISDDNANFRLLVRQGSGCSIPD